MLALKLGVGLTSQQPPSALDLSSAPSLAALWRSTQGITLNGSNIAAQADQSALGHHGLQPDPAQQPPYHANGGPNDLPYISFTGDRNLLATLTATLKSSTLTMYAVFRLTALTGWQTLINTSDDASWQRGYGFAKRVATAVYQLGGWVDKYNVSGVDVPVTANTWTLIAIRYDGTNVTVWKNGAVVGTVAFAGPIVHGSGPLCLGAAYVSAGVYQFSLNGDYTDLGIFNTAHSNDTVGSVFRGLSNRTGVALS